MTDTETDESHLICKSARNHFTQHQTTICPCVIIHRVDLSHARAQLAFASQKRRRCVSNRIYRRRVTQRDCRCRSRADQIIQVKLSNPAPKEHGVTTRTKINTFCNHKEQLSSPKHRNDAYEQTFVTMVHVPYLCAQASADFGCFVNTTFMNRSSSAAVCSPATTRRFLSQTHNDKMNTQSISLRPHNHFLPQPNKHEQNQHTARREKTKQMGSGMKSYLAFHAE